MWAVSRSRLRHRVPEEAGVRGRFAASRADADAIFRRLQARDLPAYQVFMLQALRAHPDRFRLMPEDLERELPPLDDEPDGFTLVAEVEGVLAGVVSVRREPRFKCRHKALLYRMYVDAGRAGRGIGRRLLEQAITQARGIDGLRHLNLTVLADNHGARHLYRSAGFVDFANEPDAVFADGGYRNELQMKRILAA